MIKINLKNDIDMEKVLAKGKKEVYKYLDYKPVNMNHSDPFDILDSNLEIINPLGLEEIVTLTNSLVLGNKTTILNINDNADLTIDVRYDEFCDEENENYKNILADYNENKNSPDERTRIVAESLEGLLSIYKPRGYTISSDYILDKLKNKNIFMFILSKLLNKNLINSKLVQFSSKKQIIDRLIILDNERYLFLKNEKKPNLKYITNYYTKINSSLLLEEIDLNLRLFKVINSICSLNEGQLKQTYFVFSGTNFKNPPNISSEVYKNRNAYASYLDIVDQTKA